MTWRRVSERILHDGYRRIAARVYDSPDGPRQFEIKLEPETASVLALTPTREVVLVREFRPGPEEWLLELPGGVVDDGERPEEAARRELLEETGYDGDVRAVGTHLVSAYSTQTRHVYIADRAKKLAESVEGLDVVLLSVDAFREHLRSGRLTDVAAGYLALDALHLL